MKKFLIVGILICGWGFILHHDIVLADSKLQSCINKRGTSKEAKEACECTEKGGILLASDIPGIGRCIQSSTSITTTTNKLASVISRIIFGMLGIAIFGMIVRGGIKFVIDPAGNGPKEGKELIINAIIAAAAISVIGVVLRFINPNIFT